MDAPRPAFTFGAFTLDFTRAALFQDGREVKLRPQAFDVLAHLALHAGTLVTKQALFETVWSGTAVTDGALVQCIADIRQALGDADQTLVRTVPRRGYIFDPPPPAPRTAEAAVAAPAQPARRSRAWVVALAGACVLAGGVAAWLTRGRWLALPPAGAIHSLAVLPLQNLSGDPSQEYFADGMTDELITDLGQSSGLSVISRTSVMRFKDSREPLPAIASALNVDAVIEGSVVRDGARVRITVQLIDARTDRHLWARSYERDEGSVLALQGEVARAIAAEVRARLTPSLEARLNAIVERDPRAEEAYLRGIYHLNRGGRDDLSKSLEEFRLVLAAHPHDAASFAGIAEAYLALSDYYVPPGSVLPAAKEAAAAAVALDDTLAEAHAALGSARFLSDWDWPGAERELLRAIELNPGSSDARISFAVFLAQMGRQDEAQRQVARAEALDPLSIAVRIQGGWVAYLARANDRAIAEWRAAYDLDPHAAPSHTSLWVAYLPHSGFERVVPGEPASAAGTDETLNVAALVGAYATAGRVDDARRLLRALTDRAGREYVCPYEMATAEAILGDRQAAIRWLEKAYRERSACIPDMKTDPRLDPLRSDARFTELLRTVNFPR